MSDSDIIQAIYHSLYSGSGNLGNRLERAAAADPQNVWTNIFTIAGGAVLITKLIGIRTVVQAGGASNMQYRHSIGPTVLCAATAITADALNTIYEITGNVADAIQIGAAGAPIQGGIRGGLLATGNNQLGITMFTGNIQVNMTAAAGTGSTGYILYWIPLSTGATVVAA